MRPIIVIPTYNERDNIVPLIHQLFSLRITNLEIVIVDDNSPDGTAEVIASMRDSYNVHLVKRLHKLGLGTAYIAGFKKALALGADIVFEMDADFSHDPSDVPKLLETMNDYDLAIGSRRALGGKIIGWSWRRHLTSFGANSFARLLLGLKSKDTTAGFRCFRRFVLETIQLETIKSNGYAFQEELLYRVERAGYTIAEVPVLFIDRTKGKSKLGGKDVIEFFVVILRLFLQRFQQKTVQ